MRIVRASGDFADWDSLHALLVRCFAYMEGRIDPPSSLAAMGPAELEAKSRTEILLLAMAGARIAGCLFLRLDADAVYIGKLAVDAPFRRQGLARRLIAAAEAIARETGRPKLVLQTRVELAENQDSFARLGFAITARTAHQGFDRPTSVTMTRPVGAPARAVPHGEPA
ncbi:hypothetical protein AWJ14_05940 [Hoeflea olei]|uniref:N-acetyltransferase domain-containing protein n=1 Tax=Hoeflea olei TaxID=1480615 RepID=A0A1C1YQL1_9HYPH|nr:hypothetical protein AWJ14_05940 [Hoeflea olei]